MSSKYCAEAGFKMRGFEKMYRQLLTPGSPVIDTQVVLAQPGSRRVSMVRVQILVRVLVMKHSLPFEAPYSTLP